ncbi:hypothetical protein ASG25_02105 [Rhizobium sp. Leaf384]|uniref:DUF3987 domain-containing protein n=1 Tax=unclassified Rhizobium TaxID=2613769 RepID=UPI0007151918|nr:MULTISPECIES: DUF3987 domain-containing protein [unclassified Rhizobium]KQS80426.1 hypothetical protein ASG25_02105 [Rhizobium sp. Leaf384]KQS86475.1 hypothetical protein ASG58_17170 [Rhizobium sp. Leaf383]
MARTPAFNTAVPITFNEAAVRGHVEMLHQLAAGLAGLLVVSTFYANPNGDEDVPGVVSHHRIGDVDGMVEAILCHAETPHANVFAGLQVMRPNLERGKRGTEADIVALLGLVVDLDADTGRDGAMPFDASIVLETSPGNRQPFVLFDSPVAPAEAKPLAAALKRATNSDHGTADVAHVWRIPGTFNYPNKKKLERGRSADPAPVFVVEEWQGELMPVADLRAALDPWAAEVREASRFDIGQLPASGGVQAGDRAAQLLAANDVGDRSEHAARVVEQLAFDGHTVEGGMRLFIDARGDWLRRYSTEERAATDFRRMWGKFGVPLIEERAARSEAAQAFVESAAEKVRIAANDNHATPLNDTPPMHPDPFTPQAAGGLLENIANWIHDTAIVPVRELSLAAAIALLGGCFGKLAIGPTNAGVNGYLCTILGTAGGKGHPPKAIRNLGDLCGAVGAVSNGDPTSYAAIERMLRKNISTVAVLDEFGILLQDVNGRNQSSASASIRKMLLAIFDQSNSVFDGRIYASSETKKDDGPLVGPALTVLAMTTPSTLYSGLSAASVSDGFINRFVFVTGTRDEGNIRPPRLDVDLRPPAALVASLQGAITGFPRGPKSDAKHKVQFAGGEAGDAYKRWGQVFMWQHRLGWDQTFNDIIGRAAENTVRLATIRAISRDARSPEISLDDIEWAWAIVFRSIHLIAEGVDRHMSESPAEALRKTIVEVIREAKDGVVAYSVLLRRKGIRGADLKEIDAALQYLLESGEVSIEGRSKPGAGSKFRLPVLAT